MPDVHNLDPNRSPRGGGVSDLEAFFALAGVWSIGTEQQITLLGSPSRSTRLSR